MARRKHLKIALLLCALALLVGLGRGIYTIKRLQLPWQRWFEFSWQVQRKSIELEIERLVHRILPPDPAPQRYAHIDADALQQAMLDGADWLLLMQEQSGRFNYWYDPATERFSGLTADNFLRQAGTAYALTQVYEVSGESRFLDAARANLHYLLHFKKELDDDKAYFIFQRKAKLGGASLTALIMLQLRRLTGTAAYDEDLGKLANFILYQQQQYGTGQYKSTYVYDGDYHYERNSGWESKIYPGEAMLALAELYKAFADPRYKESLDWALAFYRDPHYWRAHAFLPWTIAAFASPERQTGSADYADYAFTLSDFLLTEQNLDTDDPVYGSFHGLPSINTASYLEGLLEAISLAQSRGDSRRQTLYQTRAKMGYAWILSLQNTPANAINYAAPEKALGGFRRSPDQPRLRIDNTQHAVAACAKGLLFLFGRPAAVTGD